MIRVSTSIQNIIEQNALLEFGMAHRLFNLTQLAKYLRPLVEVQCKKDVTESAILMNLSRLQKKFERIHPKLETFVVENIVIHSHLCTYTFHKNATIHKEIQELYKHVQEKAGYMTITEAAAEITIMIGEDFISFLEETVSEQPKFKKKHISAVGVKFSEHYTRFPGFIYFLAEKLTLQNINIIEISSTYTQLIFYVDKDKTQQAFDTIYTCFTEK